MPAAKYPEADIGNVRAGRVLQWYALPACPGVPDMLVDMGTEQTVPAHILAGLTRTTTLSEAEWLKMMVHHATFRFRKDPSDIFLPSLLGADDPTT